MPIHTVTLQEPMLLLINLKYCRSPDGVVIHRPTSMSANGIADKIQRTLEGFLDEGENEKGSTILLTDTVGQRLMLCIENIRGRGGQRHIIIFCPYWIVNNTQYTLRMREEGNQNLPAGSVTTQKDGSRPVAAAYSREFEENEDDDGLPDGTKPFRNNSSRVPVETSSAKRNAEFSLIFPGTKGHLHSSIAPEFHCDSHLKHLLLETTFEQTTSMAYMFTFNEDARPLVHRRVSIQLDDSDWCKSFSLDSVGVNQVTLFIQMYVIPGSDIVLIVRINIDLQVASIDDFEKGVLEVGFKITMAPGRLSKYTKIVRFLPKFTIVNRLPMQVRLYQPVGLTNASQSIDVHATHIKPCHLPALFGERQLSIQVEGAWHRSVAFDVDQIGVNMLRIKRHVDLASITHVNTRGDAEYKVHFPKGEIGIWFETDWGEENIVVKSFRPDSFAVRSTDIQVGDVLIAIDGQNIQSLSIQGDASKSKGDQNFELVMLLLLNQNYALMVVK